jgi:hypothetical protein
MTRPDGLGSVEACTAELTGLAEQAAQAVRAINHATITGPPLPAPCVYDVLGALKLLGYGLDQATSQLADRLAASVGTFDLYECDGSDPADQVAVATVALARAAGTARALGELLDAAQSAIAGQGCRP